MTAPSSALRRAAASGDESPIIRPGANCWRVESARRAAVLVDGLAYFGAFADAAAQARHSILIVGWDFNSSVRLHPEDQNAGAEDQIGAFLNRLVTRRRALRVHVLDWDFSLIYALQREMLPRFRMARRTHRRFRFRLDNCHPVGGAQHQKIVVIDDCVAFVGGFDFAACRWDTPAHDPDDARRIDPWGKPYAPYHDAALAVDGDAAAALGDLVRERWQCATGKSLPRAPRGLDAWPVTLSPDLRDVEVAITRTAPAYNGRPEAREVEALYVDAIAAARRSLYFENQYLTSSVIGDALAARLQEPDGPEIVILQPCQCEGWLEETTMGVLRARLMRRLQTADRYGRLRAYHPAVAGLDGRRLTVHAKVLVVDDRLLRVGSANLNNRSMGLDSECDLAIEAGDQADVRAHIAAVRDRLLGEHLGESPERVADVMRSTGSLIRTIDTLSGPARGLRPLETTVPAWLEQLVPDAAVVDPERPIDLQSFLAQLSSRPTEPGAPRSWWWPAAAAASAGAALLLAWLY